MYTGFAPMKNIDLNSIPSFDELPVHKDAPADSSWGVFGDEDALGCLNFLTPAGVVDAAQLVRTGKVFRLDAKIGFAKPPLFGRAAVVHTVSPLGPTANDDLLDRFNTQEGSQWDGLGMWVMCALSVSTTASPRKRRGRGMPGSESTIGPINSSDAAC